VELRLLLARLPDFLDFPNSGGVYKVWVTPTGNYNLTSCGNGCFFGFVASASKTDNFKVLPGIPNFCLTVYKQVPGNTSSGWTGLSDWPITVIDSNQVTIQGSTDATGMVQFCSLPAGTYTVTETSTAAWMFSDAIVTLNGTPTTITTGPVVPITWNVNDLPPSIVFQNVPPIA
jgi:hypothetical protein